MYREILSSVLPIILCLALGYLAGSMVSQACRAALCKAIGPSILLLLLVMGVSFGGTIRMSGSGLAILGHAALYAAASTLLIGMLIAGAFGLRSTRSPSGSKDSRSAFLATLKECLIALACVAAGTAVSYLTGLGSQRGFAQSATILLYVIIAMIGWDLSGIKLATLGLSRRALMMPLLVIIGSLAGGAMGSLLLGDRLHIGLALASGFGWFSMSGALIGRLVDPYHGAIALLTDLFRELLAIVILYMAGKRTPGLGVAASGAAAMDSTLPIIRRTCPPEEVSTALISGFVLTMLAPLLIALFASVG